MNAGQTTATRGTMARMTAAALWIFTGTALGFIGTALLAVGLDGGERLAIYTAWPVLYCAGILVTIGTIAAGIQVARSPR